MRSAGFENLSIEGLIRLKNHDVDRDFIRRAKVQGFSNATLEELIRLRNRGTVK